MSEWWTYSPSDFLLFSSRTYYRLLEIHNAALWPAHLLTLAIGVMILVLVRRETPRGGRLISAVVAILWAWVAWSFLWSRYSTINWAARYAALIFGIEALLVLWLGVVRGRLEFRMERGRRSVVGVTLFVTALALYPLLLRLLGREWRQVEVFGIAADPTVIATLGLLLTATRLRRGLLVIPALWCVLSAATLWLLGSPETWPLILVMIAVIAAVSLETESSRDHEQRLREHAASQ